MKTWLSIALTEGQAKKKRKGIMKVKAFAAAVCTVALSTALACGLSACSGNSVAATVGSKTISEQTITDYIASYRSSQGLDDDSTFAMVLSMYGMTPETFREMVIDMYVNRELVLLAAQEKDMSVDSSTIDEYVDQIKSNYSDDSAWQTALKNAGLTEQEYRDNIEYALLNSQLSESFGVAEDPTDDQVLSVAQENLKYFEKAKRSSHILFDASDEETAQEVLAKINDGSLDFAEAAATYSKDTSSAENGGDVGWDLLTSFVSEYQTALDDLSLGQVSGLVESQYGYHIIKCTEVMPSAEDVKALSDLPEAFQEYFKQLATTTTSDSSSTAFSIWLNGYRTTVDVKINPMPKNLPYDVDMSSASSAATTSSEATSATTEDGDSASEASDASTDASSSESTE